MPYPRRLINEGETVVLDLKPHWWFFARHIAAGVGLLIVLVLVFGELDGSIRNFSLAAWLVALLLFIGWLVKAYLDWQFTFFVLTDDRVIYRTGVFAKHGVEIPLTRVNNINFHQGIVDRLVGAGTLEIESAGHDGESRFSHVRHPDGVQQEIYRQMEAHTRKRAGWTPDAASPAAAAPARERARGEHPRADQAARRAPRERRDQPGGVRGEEGAAARAHVTAPPRVVSLVPSATETLYALGIEPVGITRFCDPPPGANGMPQVIGGTKNPDLGAIVALAPDLVVLNDEENRVEDARALTGAGLTLHSMSPRSVTEVGLEVRTLAARVERAVPSPFGRGRLERLARVDAHAAVVGRVRRGLAATVDVARGRHLRRVAPRSPRRRQHLRRLPRSLSAR